MTQPDTSIRPDQMAPHSIEAEGAVLGSILTSPDHFYDASFLAVDDFFIVRNAWVFEAIRRLHDRGDVIDYLTVGEELKTQLRLDEVGGWAYLTWLINHTPAGVYAATYAELVRRAALRRRLLMAGATLARLAHDEDIDIHEVVIQAEAAVFEVTARNRRGEAESARDIVSALIDEVEDVRIHGRSGLLTGFTELDSLTGGLQKSDLGIIAGRPGMGKTSWLLTTIRNAIRKSRARVGLFSLEMSKLQVMQRLVAMESGLSTELQRSGKLTDSEFARFIEISGELSNLGLWIDDTPALTITELRGKAKRLFAEHGINLLVVDYLQLMAGSGRSDNRVLEIGEISGGLKQIARELNIPVLAAAQLSRKVEDRADKRPCLSDLRESGSIENDADVVMFIYRDDYYNDNTERPNQADINIAKHRNGPTGTATLYFRKELTEFANLSRSGIDLASYNIGGYRGETKND